MRDAFAAYPWRVLRARPQTLAIARSSFTMFGFGGFYAVMAAAAARCPARANLIAGFATVVTVAVWDPSNDAGLGAANGREMEGSMELAAYGSLPFLFGSVVVPQIEVLTLAMLAHSVRRGGGVIIVRA